VRVTRAIGQGSWDRHLRNEHRRAANAIFITLSISRLASDFGLLIILAARLIFVPRDGYFLIRRWWGDGSYEV
jgi:hypothetical protein